MGNHTWLQRFYDKVDTSGECWLWTGAIGRGGYGLFWFLDRGRTAHRGLYEAVVGSVPDGFEVDHLCRTRNCVRLDHLEAVTKQVNNDRAYPHRYLTGVGLENSAKETCSAGHPLEGDNVYTIPGKKSGRYCRLCHHERANEYSRRKQAERPIATHCANGHEYVEGSFYTRKDRPKSRYCLVCKQSRHQIFPPSVLDV